MLAQAGAGLAEAAQVDHAGNPGALGRLREGPGHYPVGLGIARARRDHRVDEIVGWSTPARRRDR
jgi:hypothetical protein